MSKAPLNEGEICIKGSKYRIVNPDADEGAESGSSDGIGLDLYLEQQKTTGQLETLEEKVDKLIDIMGAGTTGGGYRSVNLTLPPREQKFQVMLGLLASQMHIRSDQGLTMNINSRSGEDIFIEVAEFPFSLSELHKNESVHTLYFTTGANTTNIKILAIGTVL
jgi:hypothetical protein